MKFILLILLLILSTACTVRMGAFAPRLLDIAEHRGVTNTECLDCHDLSQWQDHRAEDDCLHCHHLIKGV